MFGGYMEEKIPILVFEKQDGDYLGRVLFYIGKKIRYKDVRPIVTSKIQASGSTILDVEKALHKKINLLKDKEKKESQVAEDRKNREFNITLAS